MLGSDQPQERQRKAERKHHGGDAQQPQRRHRHPRAGHEAADEAPAREERQRDAPELRAAVTLGERREADLRAAEPEPKAPGQPDQRQHAARCERTQDRSVPPLLGPPCPHGLGERNQHRADAAQDRRDAEREHRRRRRGQQRHEQRPDDEGDLLERGFQCVRGRPQLGVDEHPRPERAQRGADWWHQCSSRSRSRTDQRKRSVEERQRAHGGEQRREDHRPRQEDPRLPPAIDATSRDRSPDRRGDEVAAGDEPGGRIAAPVLADEQQQRQPDHARGQPGEHPAEHEPAHVRDAEQGAVAREAERRDGFRHEIDHLRSALMKVEPLLYGDKKVFHGLRLQPRGRRMAHAAADALDRGRGDGAAPERELGQRLLHAQGSGRRRLPAGVDPAADLRRAQARPCGGRADPRAGRPELFAAKGEFRLRALSLERFGLGEHLAAIERLKQTLAAEGLFDASRKRPLPRFPRRIGLVTGSDAAARRDVISTIQIRFPPARVLVAETLVQGPRAADGIVEALQALAREPGIDVIVLTRGGGSFDDLLPFSDERVVRAVASCPCRSSRRSATSRTRRCATSPPTFARRPRRRPESSWCPTSRRCGST